MDTFPSWDSISSCGYLAVLWVTYKVKETYLYIPCDKLRATLTMMTANLTLWYPYCNESLPFRPPPPPVNHTLNATSGHGGPAWQLKYVDLIVLPSICLLGIVGNILNLIVLTRRRLVSGMDRLERSANFGLVALAFSDLMFCSLALPFTFIHNSAPFVPAPQVFIIFYKIYGSALLNMFLMSGTWLITSMAINRYIVVVYPFRARQVLGTRRTLLTIMGVYFTSSVITLPFFLHPGMEACAITNEDLGYRFKYLWPNNVVADIKLYRQWIWPVIATFIPVLVLAFCNTRLIQELRNANQTRMRTCQGQQIKDSSRKVTLTLVIIVLMLLFLVSPGEIIRYLDPYKKWGDAGYVVASVLNVMQALNFALNFVLYCLVNPTFRTTFRSIILFCPQCKEDMSGSCVTTQSTQSSYESKNGIAFRPVSCKKASVWQTKHTPIEKV